MARSFDELKAILGPERMARIEAEADRIGEALDRGEMPDGCEPIDLDELIAKYG